MSSEAYKAMCRNLGKLTASEREDVATRIHTLNRLTRSAAQLREHNFGVPEDDAFLEHVLRLNDMAYGSRAVVNAKKQVGLKAVTTARLAVINAYNNAAEARDMWAGLSTPAQFHVYSIFINAARSVAIRDSHGQIASVLADAADALGKIRSTFLETGNGTMARRTHLLQKQLTEAARPRVPLKVLIANLQRADYILDVEAPLARQWKKLGSEIRAFMERRGAKI